MAMEVQFSLSHHSIVSTGLYIGEKCHHQQIKQQMENIRHYMLSFKTHVKQPHVVGLNDT